MRGYLTPGFLRPLKYPVEQGKGNLKYLGEVVGQPPSPAPCSRNCEGPTRSSAHAYLLLYLAAMFDITLIGHSSCRS